MAHKRGQFNSSVTGKFFQAIQHRAGWGSNNAAVLYDGRGSAMVDIVQKISAFAGSLGKPSCDLGEENRREYERYSSDKACSIQCDDISAMTYRWKASFLTFL